MCIRDSILPGHFAACADFELLDKAYHLGRDRGLRIFAGNTLCNDHLYIDDKPAYAAKWAAYGVIASEMEGTALYTAAARYGAKALTMMSIVAVSYTHLDVYKRQGLFLRSVYSIFTICTIIIFI